MRGRLSHFETLRRLLQSDLLLLLSEKQLVEIPGKTFEYLKTGRPILALTYEGAVATLLLRTGDAWVVSPDDQPGIVNAARECYHFWKYRLPGREPDSSVVESFDRRSILRTVDARSSDSPRTPTLIFSPPCPANAAR
jgi:hypothetical protein